MKDFDIDTFLKLLQNAIQPQEENRVDKFFNTVEKHASMLIAMQMETMEQMATGEAKTDEDYDAKLELFRSALRRWRQMLLIHLAECQEQCSDWHVDAMMKMPKNGGLELKARRLSEDEVKEETQKIINETDMEKH